MTAATTRPPPNTLSLPPPTVRGTPPAVRKLTSSRKVHFIDPLSGWLILLGAFLVVNGVIFVSGARLQVQTILARQNRPQSGSGWQQRLRNIASRSEGQPDSSVFATALAEHVTQTLGATYISLGLLAICLSLVPQRTRVLAALSLVVWSTIQLATAHPEFLSPREVANRTTFHGLVVFLTSASAALSALRHGAVSSENAEK
jgi:hypothetical protein